MSVLRKEGGVGYWKRSISHRDVISGVVLIIVSLFVLLMTRTLPGIDGSFFGAGTVPRIFALLLLALGACVVVAGFRSQEAAIEKVFFRGPLCVFAAVVLFSIAVRPLGLLISTYASFMVAALGSSETRWLEAAVTGLVLTIACGLLFSYGLGLPFHLFPQFLSN